MSDTGEHTLKSELLEGKPLIKPSSTNHILYEKVVLALKTVFDPEIPVNIYDLGLIYTIELDEENNVNIYMTLTAAGCPVADEMPGWVADAIKTIEEIKKIHVEMVWEPMWGMDMMSDEARLELGFM
ncbi:MAG: DUF59 domain-containing protein [Paracoccaceae bacterium]|jgi:FeS assembly SUF system protein|nr:MAG: SUF system Fe-S cluster assembly protein [Paracoccaceae bacterium]|tara:strand:- start:65 stop:445 length:381 start_codon:yes stop_codon:yes gene_type:complete